MSRSTSDVSLWLTGLVGGGPTTDMPQLGLTEAEIAAIVGYLLGADD
jgi:mono/diheme cytochrome c family protein